jgi:hypothetical protein
VEDLEGWKEWEMEEIEESDPKKKNGERKRMEQ